MTGDRGYRWRSLRLLSTIVVVLSIGTTAVVSGASAASAKCKPNRPNDGKTYWDGREHIPGGNAGGVYSDIYNYSPWARSPQGVVAWTMLNNGGNHSERPLRPPRPPHPRQCLTQRVQPTWHKPGSSWGHPQAPQQ